MPRFPKRKTFRASAVLLLTLAALSLATCISALEQDYIKYDPAKDEFQFLTILHDLRGKDTNDLDYLAAIYKNRDHLITPLLPGAANTYPLLAFSLIRVSDHQFSPLNFFSSRPSSFDITTFPIPLNSITITPGAFFLENKTLCYYQAVTVPGKTIDITLEELSKTAQNDDLAKEIQAEIDRRAAGGQVYTWDDLKTQTLKNITFKPASTAPATQPDGTPSGPLMVLERQSLQDLKQAISAKTLRIRRDKQALLLSLPLTPIDSAAFADLFSSALQRLDDQLKSTPETSDIAKNLQMGKVFSQVAHVLTITPDPAGLTLSLDLLTFAKAAATPTRIDLDSDQNGNTPPAANAPVPPDPLQYLQTQNIPINPTLTTDQILQDFNANTLKPNPSPTPVPPGENIPQTQPTPTPAPSPTP